MLTGDRAKYLGTVFGVTFGVLLIAQQMAIFVGLMRRTAHAAIDVRDAGIWVMDPEGKNADEVKPVSLPCASARGACPRYCFQLQILQNSRPKALACG